MTGWWCNINIDDLRLITLILLLLILVISDLLLGVQLDGEADELGVLLDEFLESLLLEVVPRVLLLNSRTVRVPRVMGWSRS